MQSDANLRPPFASKICILGTYLESFAISSLGIVSKNHFHHISQAYSVEKKFLDNKTRHDSKAKPLNLVLLVDNLSACSSLTPVFDQYSNREIIRCSDVKPTTRIIGLPNE